MLKVRNARPVDATTLRSLYNASAPLQGLVPLNEEDFERCVIKHPAFSAEHCFVAEEDGEAVGFLCGCTGFAIPMGGERGYLTCIAVCENACRDECASLLFEALEQSFRAKGRKYAAAMFYNPMRLPWYIPHTNGHQHNNLPGVPLDSPFYPLMTERGYQTVTQECAMYLDLASFAIPESVRQRETALEQKGYSVDWYDPQRHTGLMEMVLSLHNPVWDQEIPAAATARQRLLVALEGNTVAGFTGPVYPEPTGRGYFAGIGVAPRWAGHGLGKLLFYRLCQAEKEAGSRYMSLFTGVDNRRAQEIYQSAGFGVVRNFAVMLKEL